MKKIITVKGQNIDIEVNEEKDYLALVKDPNRQPIAQFEFVIFEHGLWLISMDTQTNEPDWRRCGIGENVLSFVKEVSGLPIFAREVDGPQKDDGSNIIADGKPFIDRMRQKGIVETTTYEELERLDR